MPTSVESTIALDLLDYGVIVAYFSVLLGMGWYFRKAAQQDLESYFLAGRKLPGWLNGCSYAVTCMNADVAPAYCGMTVITGTFICWWYLSRFGLALMIGALLFAVFWRRLALVTSPQFYELRFSGTPAITIRSWVALRSAFIAVVAWTGAGLLGMHKVTSPLLGWDKTETFLYVIPVILFYVLLSGYIGVVWSDFFQSLIIIAASLLLMGSVWQDFGGPVGLHDQLLSQIGPSAVSWLPPADHEMLGLMGIIAWTVGTAIGYGGDVAPMSGAMEGQRILSCKNGREASKMYVWTQIVLFFMLATLTLPALGAIAKWPGLYHGDINKELAFGMLLREYLPHGLLGLAIAGILAAIMSTVSSNMNFGAQVFVNDVYARSLVKNASTKHYMFVGRVIATIIVALAIVVASGAEDVINISVFMLGLSSAELTANWGQWWWWRFNGYARIAASFGGPLIFLTNKFFIFPTYFPTVSGEITYQVVLCSMAATFVLWVIAALSTKPEPEDLLIEFYRRARPMGWWGPIAAKAGVTTESGAMPIINGLVFAAFGATAMGASVIAFSAAYVAQWEIVLTGGIVALVMGLLFKVSYRRYMHRLDSRLDSD
jgi:Na+/proline symporter